MRKMLWLRRGFGLGLLSVAALAGCSSDGERGASEAAVRDAGADDEARPDGAVDDPFSADNPTSQVSLDAGALPPFDPGSCGLHCYRDSVGGEGGDGFDLDTAPSDGVGLDEDGALVLERQDATTEELIWIANTAEGTVSKIDTNALVELGRYNIPGVDWNMSPSENGPSRTSVDSEGSVYAGSRFGTGISKVSAAGDRCPDTNGDGMITTSQGAMDVLPAGEDDCVIWTTDIGGDARGVAVQEIPTRFEIADDPDADPTIEEIPGARYVWTGGREVVQLHKLDAETGEILLTLPEPPVPVYGLALDGRGNLWIASQKETAFGRIDTTRCVDDSCADEPVCTTACSETSCPDTCDDAVIERIEVIDGEDPPRKQSSYGVTVDCNQRVWLGGAWASDNRACVDQAECDACSADGTCPPRPIGVKRYDPLAPVDERLRLVDGVAGVQANGVNGIAADASGWVWGAAGDEGVWRIDAETLDFQQVAGTGGAEFNAKGIAVDRRGRVWAIPFRMDYAMVITPGATIDDATVEKPMNGFVGPYTYSDFSGEQRRLAANEPGSYRQLFEGCAAGDKPTAWGDLEWDVDVPDNTFVVFLARTADTIAELEQAEWFNLIALPGRDSPAEIAPFIRGAGQEPGRYLELEVRLFTTETGGESADGCTSVPAVTPRVRSFGVQYECEPEFG
jgi:streptogramin lyase